MSFKTRLRKIKERFAITPGLTPPPILILESVARELDAEGAQSGAWLPFRWATLPDCEAPMLFRGEDESEETFKERAVAFRMSLPIPPGAFTRCVMLHATNPGKEDGNFCPKLDRLNS